MVTPILALNLGTFGGMIAGYFSPGPVAPAPMNSPIMHGHFSAFRFHCIFTWSHLGRLGLLDSLSFTFTSCFYLAPECLVGGVFSNVYWFAEVSLLVGFRAG